MIRPQPAAWFEIIAAVDDARDVLESLAVAGCAEIEPITRRQEVTAGQQGSTSANGGIFAVMIDGIGDLALDPNDSVE